MKTLKSIVGIFLLAVGAVGIANSLIGINIAKAEPSEGSHTNGRAK